MALPREKSGQPSAYGLVQAEFRGPPCQPEDSHDSMEMGGLIIELTEDQRKAIQQGGDAIPTVHDASSDVTYVLIPKDLFEKLMQQDYDDSPWTAEEMDALAWEAGKLAGWEEMDEYDNYEKRE